MISEIFLFISEISILFIFEKLSKLFVIFYLQNKVTLRFGWQPIIIELLKGVIR